MSGLFSKPKSPKVVQTPIPERSSTQVAENAAAQRKQYANAGGRDSTGLGYTGEADAATSIVRLLGQAA